MTENRQKTSTELLLEWLSDPDLKLPETANAKVNALYMKVMNQQISELHSDVNLLTMNIHQHTAQMKTSLSTLEERVLENERFRLKQIELKKSQETFEQKKWFEKAENRTHIITALITLVGPIAVVLLSKP